MSVAIYIAKTISIISCIGVAKLLMYKLLVK